MMPRGGSGAGLAPSLVPRLLGPGLAPGLFHQEDMTPPSAPSSVPPSLEDLAYHYQYSLYQYLPPRPPASLSDWGLPLAPAGLALGPGLRYEPLSLIATPSPLDLSVKAVPTPITPPSTPSPASPTGRKRPCQEQQRADALTPTKLDLCNNNDESATNHNVTTTPTSVKRPPPLVAKTPVKKNKAVRKLTFDEDKSSPVSGTIIRDIDELEADSLVVRKGDIDPAFNVVEVTEEAKAELASIENKIGDYVCRLCRELYQDAFSLAQHRCSCIVHVEYRCPECDKVFNCPANLASHRRWHKPKAADAVKQTKLEEVSDGAESMKDGDSRDANLPQIPCPVCQKRFRRQAYLRKHLATHSQPSTQVPAGFTIPVPPLKEDLDPPPAN